MTSDDFRENKNNKLEAKFGHDLLEIPIIYSLVKYFTFCLNWLMSLNLKR